MPGSPIKKKLIVVVLIVLITLLVISICIIYPATKKISGLKQNIENIQVELEQKYLNSQKLRRTMRELAEISDKVKMFEQVMVKPGDELKIITELENLATKNNINQALNVAFNDKGKAPLNKFYQLSFINNGLFEDHIKYLQDLENLPYYVIIKNIKFEKRKSSAVSTQKDPITLTFSAIIYAETE